MTTVEARPRLAGAQAEDLRQESSVDGWNANEEEPDEPEQVEVSMVLASLNSNGSRPTYHAMVLDRLHVKAEDAINNPFSPCKPWRKGFSRTLAPADASPLSKFESHYLYLENALGRESMAVLMDGEDPDLWIEQNSAARPGGGSWRRADGSRVPLRHTAYDAEGQGRVRIYFVAIVHDLPEAMDKMNALARVLGHLAPSVSDCLLVDLLKMEEHVGIAPWDKLDEQLLRTLQQALTAPEEADRGHRRDQARRCASPGCVHPTNDVPAGWNGFGRFCCHACMTRGNAHHGINCPSTRGGGQPTSGDQQSGDEARSEAAEDELHEIKSLMASMRTELDALRAAASKRANDHTPSPYTTPPGRVKEAAETNTPLTTITTSSAGSEYNDIYTTPTEQQLESYRASAHWPEIQLILKRTYSPVVTDAVGNHRYFTPRIAEKEYVGSNMEKALSAFMRDESLHPSRKLGVGADANHVTLEDRSVIFRNYVQLLVPVLKEAVEAGLPVTSWLVRLRSTILAQLAKRGEDASAPFHNFVASICSLENDAPLWRVMKSTIGGVVAGDSSILLDVFIELLSRNYVSSSANLEGQSKKRFDNFKRANGSLHECIRSIMELYMNMKNPPSNVNNMSRHTMYTSREHVLCLHDKLLEVVAADPNRPWARELRNHMRKDLDDVIGLLQVDKASIEDLSPMPHSTLLRKWSTTEQFLCSEADRISTMLRANRRTGRGADQSSHPNERDGEVSRREKGGQRTRDEVENRQRQPEEFRGRPRDRDPRDQDHPIRHRDQYPSRPGSHDRSFGGPREGGPARRVVASLPQGRDNYDHYDEDEEWQPTRRSTVAHVGFPPPNYRPQDGARNQRAEPEKRPWGSGRDQSPSSDSQNARPRFGGGQNANQPPNGPQNRGNYNSNQPPQQWQGRNNDRSASPQGQHQPMESVYGGQRSGLLPRNWTAEELKIFKTGYLKFAKLDALLGTQSAGEAARIRPLKEYTRTSQPLQMTGEQNPPPIIDEASGKRVWPPSSCAFCAHTPQPPPDCKMPMTHQYCFGHHQSNHASVKCYAAKLAVLYSKDPNVRAVFCPDELRKYQDPPRQ